MGTVKNLLIDLNSEAMKIPYEKAIEIILEHYFDDELKHYHASNHSNDHIAVYLTRLAQLIDEESITVGF